MKDLLKFCRWVSTPDTISDCAKNLKDLQKLKMTYPPQEEQSMAICVNLKALIINSEINKLSLQTEE